MLPSFSFGLSRTTEETEYDAADTDGQIAGQVVHHAGRTFRRYPGAKTGPVPNDGRQAI